MASLGAGGAFHSPSGCRPKPAAEHSELTRAAEGGGAPDEKEGKTPAIGISPGRRWAVNTQYSRLRLVRGVLDQTQARAGLERTIAILIHQRLNKNSSRPGASLFEYRV
jgi:hypothetical protein